MPETRRAKDVMRRDVITVSAKTDVWELARVLSSHGITGAPVVDEKGDVVGVVSQTDIVRTLQELDGRRRGGFYADADDGRALGPRRHLTAADLMSREVIRAPETTPAAELSRIMLQRGVHRIIITRGRRLVGIVTTTDLLRVL